jgi:hypothetical protein
MPEQTNLFNSDCEIDDRLKALLLSYRKEFGGKKRSARGIKAFFSNGELGVSALEVKKVAAIIESDAQTEDVNETVRERIFNLISIDARRYVTFAHTFCKLAANAGIYVNLTQAQELSDRWNIIAKGTVTQRKNKKIKIEEKFPQSAQMRSKKKSANVRLNENANYLLGILADHFDVSKTTMLNAAVVFLGREVRRSRGDDVLEALEFQLPHVRALASTLHLRPRHVDTRELKAKLIKHITNFDL